MLAWRIPWAFACTGCQVLLADTCPDCGRRHRRTRAGQPRQPGRCDLTGLPLPPPRPPGATTFSCASDPAGTPAVALPAGGRVLTAQQHVDALIAALLASRGRPAETAALRQQLDDIYAVARAAASAVNGPAALPPAAAAVLAELAARPGTPHRKNQATAAPRCPARWTATSGSSRPWRPSAPPSPTSCSTAGPTTPTRKSPPGSPPTGPAAAASPARETCSPTGTGPAPPCRPRWPGRSQPGWTASASSATARSPARPASPAPARPATWPPSSRR